MKTNRYTPGLLLALILSVGVFIAAPVFAQEVDLAAFGEAAGFTTDATITVIIARLIRTAISFVGVVAVAFMVYGGFVWMTSGGNPERLKKAKGIITNAIIGLLLVFASFAIVSFVLGALVDATDGDISGSSSSSSSYSDGGGSSVFYLSSVNTQCAESLQNLQLQFVFSRSVDSDTVEEGIVIADSTGTPVDGTFSTSGRTVTFTPSQACDTPYETEFCFDALADYTIEVDSGVIESSAGSSLACTTTYPCVFGFTTGTEVDIEDPTVVMDAPDDGESLYAGSIELIQALTTDDSGVSTVDFYLIDDNEAIYSSGVDFSSTGAVTGANVENAFFTDTAEEWDTEGYTTNEEYNIWATGYDCAGNTDTASIVTVVLRAANCNNEVLDEDLGEVDIDCGGDSTSAYYCGSCDGDECTEDSQCASGQCVDGQCVTTPKIEGVSPGDGASGNLITISGEGFGNNEGVIMFLGTESEDEVKLSAYECNAVAQWSDSQIIVQVPSAAVDGPVSITTSSGETERTDDDYGPSIADFDVNAVERPGVCLLDPDEDDYGSSIDVYGNSFGDDQGSSTFYFTNYEASSYVSWSEEQLEVVVPNVNSGTYLSQVFTGDYLCVTAEGDATATTCSDDDDCDTDFGESCATTWCSETLEYCSDDDDCGDEGGDCGSIRVGSNKVSFTVADVSSSSSPVISSVDSGWKACSDDSVHCGDDDDCGEGATCDDALNWGPAGQYITIYGTGFGTTTGSIFFENESLGYTALGDTDFPHACGDDFWHDTYVTVKVPQTYLNVDEDDEPIEIETIEHALTVERADGQESDATDFVVIDNTPGPAICDIDPSSGPADSRVTIYGENFGTDRGGVRFYSLQEASFGVWGNEEISNAVVPDEAVTGPVRVIEDVFDYVSNSMTFNVGDCREDASLCDATEGESCCANGSCSSTCEIREEVEAHYAFMITTGITPNTPNVIVSCTESGVSPTPWEGWSQPEDICVTASVEAEFDMAMEQLTINPSTVVVRKCTATFTQAEATAGNEVCSFSGISCSVDRDCVLEDEECLPPAEGECKNWLAVSGNVVTDATGFAWSSTAGSLGVNTLYRVTLQGEDQIQSAAGGYMTEDYAWEFTTSSSGAPCEVGDVNVRPFQYTQTQQANVDYSAQLIAANDLCVAVSCTGYALNWESDFDGATIATSQPGVGICTNVVAAQDETPADNPALITATVMNAQNDPSDDGELTINFLDPEIDDYFPQCSTACVNALPWAEFNTVMLGTTIDEGNVTLYECLNSLCETSGLSDVDFVDSISYSSTTQRFSINFEDDETMDADTWYRVVVDGDAVFSYTGVALSESGSNYGTDENRYFANDFSWTFKTKDDAVSCAIDSVSIDPELATMTYVGERAEFDATSQGAPDDCSVNGQTLQSGSYEWGVWTATDSPNNVGPTTGSSSSQNEIVAYMVLGGAIALTTDIPAYCTAACLNAGAPVTTAQGVCGNNVLEASEECDDGGVEDDDGCSSSCLNEGNTQCPLRCDDSSILCVNDASCAESCESALCTSAKDVDEVCTLDADCNSGSCLVTVVGPDVCEDYEDAESSCTSNASCDSLSCAGTCSISGNACAGSSSVCPFAVGDTCELSGTGCCGDGARQWTLAHGGEECDDSNLASGDGCSSICLNEGSRAVGATCGDGVRDWAANTGGEDCDDGNSATGDGCSSNCQIEGSTSEEDVYAICGNGTSCASDIDCESDEACNDEGQCVESGEDCDPGVFALASDGCSSSCLYEGTSTCPTSASTNCCGNSTINIGEECDGEEGCSGSCLWAGSSYLYSTPSFCGDADDSGIGEECDALATTGISVGDYAVSQIATGAPEEVEETTGYAISNVSVTVDGDVTGDATLQLQCACTTDNSCGATAIGCGVSNCCFERPTIVEGQVFPASNSGALEDGDDGYCRNTAVWLEFSQFMDENTFDETQDDDGDGIIDQSEFDANLYLDLVSVDSNGDGVQEEITELDDCPRGYEGGRVVASSSEASRFWNWLKQFVLGIFGRDASASNTFACHIPVTYELDQNEDDTMRVYLRLGQLLEENAVYRLVVVGDKVDGDSTKDGVLSQSEVTLCLGATCSNNTFEQEFEIGEDICDLDRVLMEDTGNVTATEYEDVSAQYFSSTGEVHAFIVTPQTYRIGSGYEEISPLTGLYEWSWAWSSSVSDTSESDVVASASEVPQDMTRNYAASGYTGREHVLSTATITVDQLFTPTTAAIPNNPATPADDSVPARTVSGTLEVTALVCENPWPSLDSTTLDFPYLEDDLPSNFSFYYCRDAGDTGTDDDLPGLEDPIDVTSLSSSGILQELIFKVEDSSDAIGIRVLPNAAYLTPSAWVEAQEFTGTFSETELNGYPAVSAGNTLYAAAANVSGSIIYPNIYIVSYNDNASEEAQEIFAALLANWRFNGNTGEVTDINLCIDSVTSSYTTSVSGAYLECDWDGDCFEACDQDICSSATDVGDSCTLDISCESGSCSDEGVCDDYKDASISCPLEGECDSGSCVIPCSTAVNSIVCDAQKGKLTRDMTRLLDVVDMATTINGYGESNGHCSVTKGQSCEEEDDCPGTEECLAGFPQVQSGTFVPALSNSIWSSWSASLGNDLGSALPTDPINEFYNCSASGYDAASCWNGEEGTFVCPENSHLYGYQSVGGEEYLLYAQLETDGNAIWDGDIDTSSTDEVTIVVEYPAGNAPSTGMPLGDGFESTPVFCDGGTWGDSSLCGDGTQGATERCEVGDTMSIACTDADGDDGVITVTCDSDCGVSASTTIAAYQTEAEAEAAGAQCSPYSCGNGVVETGETCDDGSLNGTYGHCDDECGAGVAIYCGDGYLASSEECDCGTTSTYATVTTYTSSWATIGPDGTGTTSDSWCDVSNGQYDASGNNCAYNCTSPGLICGDGRVNGSEECDGDYEDTESALCSDGTKCTTDADCDSRACGDGGAACGVGDICTDFDDAGEACVVDTQCDSGTCLAGVCTNATDAGDVCTSNADDGESCTSSSQCDSGSCSGGVCINTQCDSGLCGDFNYDLFRFRTCSSSCGWMGWSGCVGGTQICGNGIVEGNEACDDGNSTNNDECLNTCVENVCGDDYVYVGLESCDDGDSNGDVCEAGYEDTCNYCNATCQYKTASGGYCGDSEVDTGEVCDGGYATTLTYYDSITVDTSSTCTTYDGSMTDDQDTSSTADDVTYTCRWLGVCNGGDENGALCTLNYTTYTSTETVSALTNERDTNGCSGGTCVAPVCAADCGSSCPTGYESTGLLVQSEASGSSLSDSISLYSYLNDEGDSPDNGVLYVPACSVATSITADINDSDVTPPDVDIVFVTDLSGSMSLYPGIPVPAPVDQRRIDYVVEATQEAVEELFDAYDSIGATMRISLVSFSGDIDPADGVVTDSPLVDGSSESALQSILDGYLTAIDGTTPTYAGIEEAVGILTDPSSTAGVKIVILLSDGEPSDNQNYYGSNDSCSGYTLSDYPASNNWTGVSACVAEIADDLIDGGTEGVPRDDIFFYSAAVTTNPDLVGYMSHMSSNTCDWSQTALQDIDGNPLPFGITSTTDCEGNYAYAASNAEDIEAMYVAIVDSILGTNVTFTATDEIGDTITTTGEVQAGSDVELPFPDGFVCQSTEQTIPLRNVFYGSGSMLFDDLNLTYCPYE